MKTPKLPYAFKPVTFRQLVLAAFILTCAVSASAQSASTQPSNIGPWSNMHFVYDEQPNVSVYTSAEAASAMPSALVNDAMSEITDVSVWDNAAENHLLVMVVNTVKKNLTAIAYDANGNKVMHETPIDPGSYRMIEHTGNLKPGTYFLHIMERGKVIEKEKFVVK